MLRHFLFLILIATGCCAAAESKLHGTWKSDLKLTSDYLEKYAKLSEHQKKGIKLLFGRNAITFKPDGTGLLTKEAFVIESTDGAKLPMAGGSVPFTYEIAGESEGQVAVKITSKDPEVEKSPFFLMRFDGKDVYSIEIGGNNFDLQGREFFQRSEG